MSTDRRADPSAATSPRFRARLAGFLYLINTVTSLVAFSGKASPPISAACGWVATASYVGVTVLFYLLFKPVNRTVSLIAALFSLAGCADGVLTPLHLFPFPIHSLVFFGVYCVLIGYLILRSTFLPRILGLLMTLAGLGWLTFVYAPLATSLSPYPYIMGGVGEISLWLWMLVMGVDAGRWDEQAGARVAVAG
jgi:hypothetical protein